MPSRHRRIFALALPIIGGMVSQNVLNLVDQAMVGSLGDVALAAVGLASFANFLCIAFITGLSAGVQAMSARRLGEGRHSETAIPLNGGLALASALGLPLAVALFLFAPVLIGLLADDAAVANEATPYLRARLVGMVGVGANFAFRGYFNGVNLSKLYFRTLVTMHVCNVAISYVLIFGALGLPAFGSLGAGMGTTASVYIGTFTYVSLARKHAKEAGFLSGLPDKGTTRTMLRLALPNGIQQFFFAGGMTVLFAIIGRVGTRELAASTVLLNLLLVALLPGMGFGIAAASLVGQALGRGDPDDAHRWGWEVVKVAALTMGLLALPVVFFPDPVLAPFLHDPVTLALARTPLRLIMATVAIDTLGMVLMHGLIGAGDTRTVMVLSVASQWFLMLPAVYLVGPVWGLGLTMIWVAQVATRLLQAGAFAAVWQRRGWASLSV